MPARSVAAETFGTGQFLVRSRAVIVRSALGGSGELSEELGDPEGHIDALASIEPGVAHGFVPAVEVGVRNGVAAPDAFSDVLTGELDVDTARPGAFGSMGSDEAANFAENLIEVSGLAAVWRAVGIAVHRVASPNNGMTSVGNCT